MIAQEKLIIPYYNDNKNMNFKLHLELCISMFNVKCIHVMKFSIELHICIAFEDNFYYFFLRIYLCREKP